MPTTSRASPTNQLLGMCYYYYYYYLLCIYLFKAILISFEKKKKKKNSCYNYLCCGRLDENAAMISDSDVWGSHRSFTVIIADGSVRSLSTHVNGMKNGLFKERNGFAKENDIYVFCHGKCRTVMASGWIYYLHLVFSGLYSSKSHVVYTCYVLGDFLFW